ncbi:MAG: hypothetical protein LPJ89_01980 [Hymenobacteraceae bacterium]|nr:hypothetical protein [Hymenobacteraceae bacterium]MDX5396826.1 hypothetical protein [Hymenobacteraceae bacterium]MDX5442532.1 hypothetical protein [Hymenobacteraceae bacterium]MDX5512897.1 hypothetical protein [Hymenobacteraceae bacterium]
MTSKDQDKEQQKESPDINKPDPAIPDQEASHYDENGQGGQGGASSDLDKKEGRNSTHDIGNERSIAGREDS